MKQKERTVISTFLTTNLCFKKSVKIDSVNQKVSKSPISYPSVKVDVTVTVVRKIARFVLSRLFGARARVW